MARLNDVSVDELEAALSEVSGSKETERLLVSIIYKRGPSVPMIAEWLDIRPATIYQWFDRLETKPVETAVRDRGRPGRPSKLTDEQRREFRDALSSSAAEYGYDGDVWTVDFAQQYLEERFGVEYSRRHVRRLLDTSASSG